jgi:hypothetical protein
MSNPRYDWWPYVKGMIRRYPALKERYDVLKQMTITAQLTGMPGSNNISKPTEDAALRLLPPINQKEFDAVHRAIETTKRYKNGDDRMKVIKLVLWDKSHTLAGAAIKIHCSEPTVWRWHSEFIRLTASYFGLLDEIDSQEPNNSDIMTV